MKKINFSIALSDIASADPLSDEYILLAFFIEDNRYFITLDKTISKLESIRSGEKKFDDIQSPSVYWSIGEGSGSFECDRENAYFTADEEYELKSCTVPLQEVIDLLKDWRAFQQENNAGQL